MSQLPSHPPTPQKKILAKKRDILVEMDGLFSKINTSLLNLRGRKRKIKRKAKKKHQTGAAKEERFLKWILYENILFHEELT